MAEDPRQEVERALRKLAIRPEQDWHVRSMVDALSNFAGKTNVGMPARFLKVSRATAEKELKKLGRLTDTLADHLGALHEPATVALADQRVLVHDILRVLGWVALAAKRANVSAAPEKMVRGRPTKPAPYFIARLLAAYYEILTGKKPTIVTYVGSSKVGGSFFKLVDDVFKALGVQASVEGAAREVLKKSKGEKSPKNST